jgi:hypothetical protein
LKCLNNGARLSCRANNEDYFSKEVDCTKLGGIFKIIRVRYAWNLDCVYSKYDYDCLWQFFICWFLIYFSLIIVAKFAIHFFKKLACFNTIQTFDAADFNEDDIPQQETGALFISQSGETRDIYLALKECKNKGVFCLGISTYLIIYFINFYISNYTSNSKYCWIPNC